MGFPVCSKPAVGYHTRFLVLQTVRGSYCPMVVAANADAEGQQYTMQHDVRDGEKAEMIRAAATRLAQQLH
jgi:hypothetical protein